MGGEVVADVHELNCLTGEVVERDFTLEELTQREAEYLASIPTLEQVKEQKILELNTACNQEILNGFPSSCTGIEHQYKFDMEYQGNFAQQGVMLSLDATLETVPWPTSDAGMIVHTREQFIQLCKDAQAWKATNLYRYFGLKAQVEACETIEAVEAFVW